MSNDNFGPCLRLFVNFLTLWRNSSYGHRLLAPLPLGISIDLPWGGGGGYGYFLELQITFISSSRSSRPPFGDSFGSSSGNFRDWGSEENGKDFGTAQYAPLLYLSSYKNSKTE